MYGSFISCQSLRQKDRVYKGKILYIFCRTLMETVESHSLFLFRFKRKKICKKERTEEEMLQVVLQQLDRFIAWFDEVVWGPPLIILILSTGIYLSLRMGFLQIRHLGKALKFMVKNEDSGNGEVTSFGALCTAMSATIGTGNIVGVATALAAGGPGALFWMVLAAFFGMATKYAEGVLAIKYRTIDGNGHVLGGPFYYIENGMGVRWRWLAKIFAFFGAGVGLLGIGTFTQVNGISSAVCNFFDPEKPTQYLCLEAVIP